MKVKRRASSSVVGSLETDRLARSVNCGPTPTDPRQELEVQNVAAVVDGVNLMPLTRDPRLDESVFGGSSHADESKQKATIRGQKTKSKGPGFSRHSFTDQAAASHSTGEGSRPRRSSMTLPRFGQHSSPDQAAASHSTGEGSRPRRSSMTLPIFGRHSSPDKAAALPSTGEGNRSKSLTLPRFGRHSSSDQAAALHSTGEGSRSKSLNLPRFGRSKLRFSFAWLSPRKKLATDSVAAAIPEDDHLFRPNAEIQCMRVRSSADNTGAGAKFSARYGISSLDNHDFPVEPRDISPPSNGISAPEVGACRGGVGILSDGGNFKIHEVGSRDPEDGAEAAYMIEKTLDMKERGGSIGVHDNLPRRLSNAEAGKDAENGMMSAVEGVNEDVLFSVTQMGFNLAEIRLAAEVCRRRPSRGRRDASIKIDMEELMGRLLDDDNDSDDDDGVDQPIPPACSNNGLARLTVPSTEPSADSWLSGPTSRNNDYCDSRTSAECDRAIDKRESEEEKPITIEVSPGIYEPLRSGRETSEAIRNGNYETVICVACGDALLCCRSKYVLCPSCDAICPLPIGKNDEGGNWEDVAWEENQWTKSASQRVLATKQDPPEGSNFKRRHTITGKAGNGVSLGWKHG